MPRITERQHQQLAELKAAEERAFEAGEQFHRDNVEEILSAIWRYASRIYDNRSLVDAFVAGFMSARHRRDDYLKEKRQP